MKSCQQVIKFFFYCFSLLLVSFFANAQKNDSFSTINEKDFTNKLMHVAIKEASFELELPNNKKLEATISIREIYSKNNYFITGKINTIENAFFSITKTNGLIQGNITLINEKTGYRYSSINNDEIKIETVPLDQLMCVDLKQKKTNNNNNNNKATTTNSNVIVPSLNSLPGALATIYLDFDGEYVSGTSWNNGGAINAQPMGFSDYEMEKIWKIVSEDFSPFQVNVTTDRNVYNNTPSYKRMMAIFTTTNSAAPGSGGVAFIDSFSQNNNNPCWIYNGGPGNIQISAETASHEVGHTVGLVHDGQGNNTYYQGNGLWGPIMGASYDNPVSHWSKGEYPNANENENDLQIITRSQNFGYKIDDHGDSFSTATELVPDDSGNVNANNNQGVIERNTDLDLFSFITSGGIVDFYFNPAELFPNLNIQARILDASGNEVAISNPNGSDLSASITTNLSAGTYYIEIDGKGQGTQSNGYTEYGSIGVYSISGSYFVGDNNQPPVSNFIANIDCNEVQFTSTSTNTVTSYYWSFGDGSTSTEENPLHVYQNSGSYTISLTTSNDNGSDTKTETNFINLEVASTPNPTSVTICEGDPNAIESIELTGSNGYLWYEQTTGGEIVNSGSTLDISEITTSTTYYVSGTNEVSVEESLGELEINNNNGNIHQGGFYLIFDAQQSFLLKEAKVFAEGTGNRTLELKNSDGTTITSKVINIVDGESIIDINLTIPEGEDMQIGFANGAQLFRNNNGLNYPYTVNDVVSIKSSTATLNPTGYYYYLYDWKISTLGYCETEDRTEVVITVDQYPEIPIIYYDEEIMQLSTSDNYYSYQWYLNETPIDNANNYNYFVEENGDYTVKVSNLSSCESISEIKVIRSLLSVTDFIKENVKIYPNPLNDYLYIETNNINFNFIKGKIFDSRGRLIEDLDLKKSLNQLMKIDVSKLASGVYFIKVFTETEQGIFKLIKQ